MSRTRTRPVQVRLPEAIDDFLTGLARDQGESKTQIVVEALECLQKQLVERRMEAGYRELAGEHAGAPAGDEAGEQEQLVRAGLDATLPTIPD